MTIDESIEQFKERITITDYKEQIPEYYEAMEMAIKALEEIQMYKDGKLCLIPADVYAKQCEELDAYKEIGTVEECRSAVEKQKAKKIGTDTNVGSNGWIPVSERLPETDKYILLSFSNFSIPCVGRYNEDENGGAFYIGDDDETCVSQDLFVNAWQPLPDPYEAKEE